TLDVPGAPRVILVPGHTPGSAALLFAGHDALFVGDAMATHSVTTGDDGPRISPFTADPVQALASLDRLMDVRATLVLPGHGQAWSGGVAAAVAAVRRAATVGAVRQAEVPAGR
ncbi:MAG: MBL fold metallo-hydrolase, partial [Actinobacteria bacterium]